ncbi:hypothetical protein EVC45_10190 [Paraburkholderia sp. UYCP14C]|uniref:hypothetical protein n=1 Tax=Paraburkholderia sp. UYCP14C TaxID=2511130 RepID=UPI0010209740|nr:hypothetical protein [Paraburkholderia sp. UYCP14C]RZF29958.1 hypothetical protein EVC45_10190 [Paraburkholderia sp. UYCP14C]
MNASDSADAAYCDCLAVVERCTLELVAVRRSRGMDAQADFAAFSLLQQIENALTVASDLASTAEARACLEQARQEVADQAHEAELLCAAWNRAMDEARNHTLH